MQKQEIKEINLLNRAIEVRRNIISSEEHNMEFVAEIDSVTFINDSISFSVNTTKQSLENIHSPVILIIGGFDINSDYSVLSEIIKKKTKAVVYLGKENEKIIKFCKSKDSMLFASAVSLQESVEIAFRYATAGNAVLFSPACACGKEFTDYKIRGKEFKNMVNALSKVKN